MANRLSLETSPYLLQHKDNPVDWYPWGPEALDRARREDKPILLSIGYSACHWCHVMEHESFENPAIAELMNEHFVNIKVDREERPDLDSVYMSAVQAMTGQGGWPMTVFLTPDGRPFFGGTYFPPDDRYGRIGFPSLLRELARAYRERREDVETDARRVYEHLQQTLGTKARVETLSDSLLDQAAERLRRQFDPTHGGFGGAPKFPPAMSLEFLMRHYVRSHDEQDRHVVEWTLQKMMEGGIYDHLGGGFHRYSVDAEWLVPHFEKMLYDNALLSRLCVLAFQAFKDERYRVVAEEVFDWVVREMRSPEGGFYSTMDADSEGEEGRFYTWTYDELVQVLGESSAEVFAKAFGVTREGNFEGRNILYLPRPLTETALDLAESRGALRTTLALDRPKLYSVRSHRVWPGRDDKILTAWNGMMLRAFAEAGRILDREDYREIARQNADFLLGVMRKDGRLLRTYKDGVAKLNAYLEDYANLADGLLALYEATFDSRWIEEAQGLVEIMLSDFWDDDLGGFYDTGRSHEALIARPQDRFDNATPAGNSVACDVLLRLSAYLGREDYRERATKVLEGLGGIMGQYPNAFGRLLCGLDFALAETKEVAIIGAADTPDTHAMIQAAFAPYAPHKVVGSTAPGVSPGPVTFLRDRPSLDHKATAYVCVQQTCGLPLTEPEQLSETLQRSP